MHTLRKGRITFLSALVFLFALVIAGRLYYLQVANSEEYRSQADRQYVVQGQKVFDRGTIFFSPKIGSPISAATLSTGYLVSINPKQVEHPEDISNALSGILPVEEKSLLSILSGQTYREIAHRVNEKDKDRLTALDLAGLNIEPERWRNYPAGSLASNVLGIVGYADDGKTFKGRYGLERYYNDQLSRNSSDANVNFFAQIFSNVSDVLWSNDHDEGNIITTIEPTVEGELEKQIASVMKTWNSDMTGGIVMNPKTGEIYAMAVNPTFNPNNFSKEKDVRVFGNAMVDRVYEMGSIVKPLIMAAAIDAKAVSVDTTYDDTGFVTLNGAKISNYDGKARGIVSMQEVLNQSLNVGMVFVAQRLGNKRLTDYLNSYGFGEETGIDLPGEVRGLMSNLKTTRDLEHAQAAFGQGIAPTPIATVRALSALGNGGYLPDPHIVKRIEYTSGFAKDLAYNGNKEQVINPETSEEITRMLVNVVDKALLGGTVKQEHYSIAAKTGTAQMALESGKGYYTDRYLHSFFGYFPAYDPKFIVFLFTVYPKGAQYASHTLTQPFIDLTKFLLNYYEVPPDR